MWIIDKSLFRNIRFYILLASIFFSLVLFVIVTQIYPSERLQTIRLTQFYALTSLALLYAALLAGPFCFTFRNLPLRGHYMKARRAIGVSAFYFGFLHAYTAFFGQLGGFEGLFFLSNKYLLAISLSFTALVILFLMTMTSLDSMVARLTFPKWKLLHRLVYVAGIFTLIHALMLGTHFQDFLGFVPQITLIGVVFLLFLEGLRVDAWLEKRFSTLPRFSPATVTVLALSTTAFLYYFLPIPSNGGISLGIHAEHIRLAREAQQGSTPSNNRISNSNIPGLQGDRTKRYTVSFNNPQDVLANVDTELQFQVYDASTGEAVTLFNKAYDKIVHLIIVDNELEYFSHIHPEHTGNEFFVTTQFPKDGRYRLYIDFQPFGAIEQQMAFTLDVGSVETAASPDASPENTHEKTVGNYTITLDYPKPLVASRLSVGEQILTYTIRETDTKKEVTYLKPYLAAFGHVVMINTKTFDYLHVHPNDLRAPLPDQNGGPKVEFMPLGIYGPIKPGVYRTFAQFNPNNELITVDFTVNIE